VDVTVTNEIEATGPDFVLERFLEVRRKTRQAVHAVAERIEVAMSEDQARAVARQVLSELGLQRGWHRIIVRFGPNTTKDFSAPSDEGVVLGDNDIFFIDIGPLFDGHEGDAGETFVVGTDPEHHRAKADARTIWDEVRNQWLSEGQSGKALYAFAETAAAERGWRLNLDLSGHRLSEFPHSAHFQGAMAEVDFHPAPQLWVLEIAIIHPDGHFGAFYEDLLLEDQSFD
jgi:methionyl aminopeptidase